MDAVTIIVEWEACIEVVVVQVVLASEVVIEVPEVGIVNPLINSNRIILAVKIVRPTNNLLLSRSRIVALYLFE